MTPDHAPSAEDRPAPAFDVPPGETPVAACPHCGWPFTADRTRHLHEVEVHPELADDEAHERYEAAKDAERDELFYYHARVVGALGGLYSVLVILYMVAFGTGLI